MLGSPIGTATFTREYYRKTLPKIHAAIADIDLVTDNLLHFRFLQQSVAGKVRGKLRTVLPMLSSTEHAPVGKMMTMWLRSIMWLRSRLSSRLAGWVWVR